MAIQVEVKEKALKTSFLAIAAIVLLSAPIAAKAEDRAQLVLISGINADKRLGGL